MYKNFITDAIHFKSEIGISDIHLKKLSEDGSADHFFTLETELVVLSY